MKFWLPLFSLLWSSVAWAGPGSVAVLYFENRGNEDLEPLKVGLTQMFISDLHGTNGVTVVERAQLQAVLNELELGHSGVADPATAAKIGKIIGAEYLVLGAYSYLDFLGTMQIFTTLVRVETSEIVYAGDANGPKTAFMQLEDELAAELRVKLATLVKPGSSAPATTPASTAPPAEKARTRGAEGSGTPAVVAEAPEVVEAAVAYSEGLIFLDNKDVNRARESFEKALTHDPNLAVAKAELNAIEL